MPLPKELAEFCRDFILPDPVDQSKHVREVVSFDPENPPVETGGRVFAVGRKIMYSPNSDECPAVPPPVIKNATLWIEPGTTWPTRLRFPRWWSEETGYLAFFALNPKYQVKPFCDLFELDAYLVQHVRGHGYTMTATRKLLWVTLERRLKLVVRAMTWKYQVPPLREIITTPRLCNAFFPTKQAYCHAFLRSKAWFGVVMAQISFVIAVAHTVDNEPLDMPGLPTWYKFLLNKWPGRYWDAEFLDGLRAVAGKFGPDFPRAGVIINILAPPAHQFSVNWLKSVGVPVYHYFHDEEIAACEHSERVRRFIPPLTLLRDFKNSATHGTKPEVIIPDNLSSILPPTSPNTIRTGTAIDDSPAQYPLDNFTNPAEPFSAAPTPVHQSDVGSPPPWVAFFEERKRRTELHIKHESSKERQARQQREKNPPTVNTVVFVWEENDRDSYERIRISKKFNDDTLAEYKKTQKVYNAIFNEWDCCYDFSNEPADDSDYEDFSSRSDIAAAQIPSIAAPSATHVSPSANIPDVEYEDTSIPTFPRNDDEAQDDCGPINLDDDHDTAIIRVPEDRSPNFAQETEAWDLDFATYDMLTLYVKFYGYTPPLHPPPKSPTPLSTSQLTRLRTYVGKSRDECADSHDAPILLNMHSFMTSVLRYKIPLDDIPSQSMDFWDLVLGNREYLGMTSRVRTIRRIGSGDEAFFLFDFGDRSSEPWHLGVVSVVTALHICRMGDDLTEYEICHKLLGTGVPFNTLTHVRHHLEPVFPRRIPSRTKPLGYKFTMRDYEIYVSHRMDVLSNSRVSRAALMRGGIIWRLCDFASNRESVYDGPTKYVTELGMSASFANSTLHDDHISTDELDAISGTYIVPTGKGEQDMTVSWWPPDSIWRQYYDFDYWTDVMELKFRKRLEELDRGKAQPLPKQQWKAWVRGGSACREATTSIANASMAFYTNFVARTGGP